MHNVASFVGAVEETPESECPDGDLIFMFNNEQVVGKTGNVCANNKVKMSIITNVDVVGLNQKSESSQFIHKHCHLQTGCQQMEMITYYQNCVSKNAVMN